MVYYYMIAGQDSHTVTVAGGDMFYGWCADMIAVVVYAYTMWLFEGDDYVIYCTEFNNIQEFEKHLIERGLLAKHENMARLRIRLFEGLRHEFQAMTEENCDAIDIDGGMIREYVLSNGIERMLDVCMVIRRYMPMLVNEVRFVMYVINRICRDYLPDDDTEQDEISTRFDMVWLIDVMFGDEIVTSFHLSELNNKDFWEHCSIVKL